MSTKLKTLGEYVYDSIEGYRNAHERAEDTALKAAFASRIDNREATLSRINQALVGMGEDRITSGSTVGTFHDMWGKVLNAIGGNDQTVVSHVEEGEDFLKQQFQDALDNGDLTPRERDVVTASLTEISKGEFFADQLDKMTA